MAIEHEIKYVLKASAFVEACMRGCDPACLLPESREGKAAIAAI